ncbi:MAG: hypothetical protein H6551_01290 [Chitinophagales bacterium]|nr:hypothetical protein [Chitinophagales bacterium]
MQNNVFYQSGGGYPAYFGEPNAYQNFDYNNFFGTGTLLYFGYTASSIHHYIHACCLGQ